MASERQQPPYSTYAALVGVFAAGMAGVGALATAGGRRPEQLTALDLVAEERDAVRGLLVRGLHLDDVALHAEGAAVELEVVPRVLDLHEVAQDPVDVVVVALLEQDHLVPVLLRATQ
ncbi:MAG TPA: hypothetical protein VNR63_09305, partial [Gaiellaceae bacterium]|nr:hypothetical protein [Gaiellaceae bacterium]